MSKTNCLGTKTIDSTDTVAEVLRATLVILESASFPAEDSKAVINLKKSLGRAIAEIDTGIR